jgi:hypothetical protein
MVANVVQSVLANTAISFFQNYHAWSSGCMSTEHLMNELGWAAIGGLFAGILGTWSQNFIRRNTAVRRFARAIVEGVLITGGAQLFVSFVRARLAGRELSDAEIAEAERLAIIGMGAAMVDFVVDGDEATIGEALEVLVNVVVSPMEASGSRNPRCPDWRMIDGEMRHVP